MGINFGLRALAVAGLLVGWAWFPWFLVCAVGCVGSGMGMGGLVASTCVLWCWASMGPSHSTFCIVLFIFLYIFEGLPPLLGKKKKFLQKLSKSSF